MTSLDPERHGCEDLPAAAVAAAGCQIKDDIKLQGTESSASKADSTSDTTAAGPSWSQSIKSVSSASCEKKVTHKMPKPGVCCI